MIKNSNNKRRRKTKYAESLPTRKMTLYRNIISGVLTKDLNVSYTIYAVLTNTNSSLYSYSSSLSQTGSNNRQDLLQLMFATNGEFDKLKANFNFIQIESVRLRITTQLGYSSKVLSGPPTYHMLYLSNATPFNTSSIAQLDQAVKHDTYSRESTDVIYSLPNAVEYSSDMIMGKDYWVSLRLFPSFLYVYAGFGYFEAPVLDVVSASAIPLISVEATFRSKFACPILAA